MGIFRFSMSMLKKEYKKSIAYTITLFLTIAVTFLFFNIIDNPYLIENAKSDIGLTSDNVPFSSILSFIIIVFCAFMIIFANNFYISRKTKEIAIMTMSGSSFINITFYLFYQNLVMTLIAFPIGILIGILASLGVNQAIYTYLQYNASLFYVPFQAIGHTLVVIVTIIGMQLLYASGFVYRKDIQYMLSQETQMNMKDQRIIRINPYFYVFIYLMGMVILLTTSFTPTFAIVPCCIGVLGIGGMIKYCFKEWILKLKDKYFLSHKIMLVSLSNLYQSLRRAVLLIGIYGVSTTVMIAIMIAQQSNPREMITAMIAFIVVILLLLASIVYKYSMEASSRKTFYYNLYKLGYTLSQLVEMIQKEIIMFYMILVGLPFVYIITSLIITFIHQGITLEFMITVILAQIIPCMISGIFTYRLYKKTVLDMIKEGMRYE